MRSLKIKFTIWLTILVTSVIVIFSGVILIFNIINAGSAITNESLEKIKTRFPKINKVIEKNTDAIISDVVDTVRKDELEKFRNTLLILVPSTILLSALFSYLLSLYLLKPIEDIAQRVALINSKSISVRLPEYKDSEIQILSSSFNKLLNELESAFSSQDMFIQDASHELKTPLAAIKTTLQVLNEKQDPTIQDYQSVVATVNKINDKLIKLNNNLLFLNNKNRKFEFEKLDLGSLLNDIIETLFYEAKNKGINIESHIEDKIYINGNQNTLTLVFKNLIDNAIKYSYPNTTVNIKAYKEKGFAKIEIQDQGIGISKSDQERIFDRFYRADNSNQNNEDGEGLGLAIVKEIIDKHSGKIEVESEINKGTKFIVCLKD